jgi:hypothetical protein
LIVLKHLRILMSFRPSIYKQRSFNYMLKHDYDDSLKPYFPSSNLRCDYINGKYADIPNFQYSHYLTKSISVKAKVMIAIMLQGQIQTVEQFAKRSKSYSVSYQ